MILTDVIQLTEAQPKQSPVLLKKVEEATKYKNRFDSVMDLLDVATRQEAPTLNEMRNRLQTLFNTARGEILAQTFTLPKDLISSSATDVLSRAAETPKVKLSHIRDIADKLGFIVLPFQYLDDRSYSTEHHNTQQAIKNFSENLSPWFNVYVLSPVEFYSVYKHVKSSSDLPIYASQTSSQAFMAIEMMIPMFRTLDNNVGNLRLQNTEIAKAVNKAAEELKNLARRVNELQAQIDRQRLQALIQEQENKKLREQLEEARQEREFFAREPLMLAIPKNTSINDDTLALVGPCWGPDFKDIVFTSVGLKKITKQREALASKSLAWANRRMSY